jgi:hypothetical protein
VSTRIAQKYRIPISKKIRNGIFGIRENKKTTCEWQETFPCAKIIAILLHVAIKALFL